ncbi:MAG TPA: hypothetical protein DCS66_01140 [Flavobacteriaceae bacterium]|nr:hypothetical protein [Flavobacteriaceae bacterium]
MATALCFFVVLLKIISQLNKISNVLCEGWQPKTTSALDSGTKQKTEDFEVRKNWVLFCGDLKRYI